jgi:hypothetical protein
MSLSLPILERYHKDSDEFLNHIIRVTSDETCISFLNVETKEKSPNKMKSLNDHCLPARKLMKTVLQEKKGVQMAEFMQQETTITSEVYCKTLKKNRVGLFRTNGMEC